MLIRKIGIVSRTYRHMNRYRQIITVLFKYGFGDLVDRLHVGQYLEIGMQMVSRKRRERVEKLTRSERLRMALEELGPTFVKMGQILSSRPDLIPVEFIEELSKLQDSVPPFPFSQVREIIEAELTSPIDGIFQRFEETPLAAASIGQVHRAQLKDGEDVIVKVQRPGIRTTIEVDLEILLHLAILIERHIEEWEIHRPTRIVEEFARSLEKEIDYTIEASNAERFARQFIGNSSVYVPRIFMETTTKQVLTMEFINGIKASEIDKLDNDGLDRNIIASRGADLILEQVFKHGFFHADPHPGNVFIMPDNVICYLDFGMMGRVDRYAREHFADIVYGYVRRDESKIADAILKVVEWDIEPDRRILERDISDFVESYLYKPLKELHIGDIFQKLLELIINHGLRLPADIFLMIKAMAQVEGLGLVLDPDFDMTQRATPFIKHIKLERLSPKRVVGDFFESGGDLVQLLKDIPGELRTILKQLRQGKASIVFEHRGLENVISGLDRSSNRIASSLIISSLIIGSSLIIRTKIGPFLFGFPILGLAGFSIAGIFGIGLLISILRSGRM
ncbi:MAG: AarF/ABC1/UbiB kinase family protein [Deltaproteobacteria bacterium]|nr:AarF/ABC1/UbiB kinase family protein [Deltaproteobacteria bacterium]